MSGLTYTQTRILTMLRQYISHRKEAPPMREIGREVGLSSSSSVAHQLNQLEKLGLITRGGPRERRSIRLT